ncbi:MAG TPA: hypothetical protein PKC99_17470 [Anaerolineales bacterium]|nr:hypothetical protein [Anaerolineales bacterium]
MNELIQMPDFFKGRWDNLLILSYGADLPYFENAILRPEFRCKNKIILSDGRKFLQACERYEKDGRVRWLNQRYIADGIYTPNSAHAKLILLTTREAGKLLVGSGNLGAQGYTSGGELFTLYEYSADDQSQIAAFHGAWNLIDTLLERELAGGAAVHALRNLYEGTPWLMRAAGGATGTILHNLRRSFIEQLKEELEGEHVQELWIMAPFFDAKAHALEILIEDFQPKTVNLVIQPKYVSLSASALKRVAKKSGTKIVVHPFETISSGQAGYVHAKLYLFKTANRAVCLQGSPNCSQVAMLLPSPAGNIEIANLLTAKRQAFDALFSNLDLQPAITDLNNLDVSLREIGPTEDKEERGWLLTSASWRGETMLLYFHGLAPDMGNAKMHIGEAAFPLKPVHTDNNIVQIKLSVHAQALLADHLVPIVVEIDRDMSTPIFPCNFDLLDRESNTISSAISTQDIRNFNPEDPEFENLLRELEASFPIDRKSIWQLAGKTPAARTNDEDEDEYLLDYADIDYDLLRQHPKIQQYIQPRGTGSSGGLALTRLQQLMNAITSHFSDLADVAFGRKGIGTAFQLEGASTSESAEEEETPPSPPAPEIAPNRNRIKNILKRFIRRYMNGLESSDFVRVVGVEVIVNNYIIFSHVLWRLLQKGEWIETDFILDAFYHMWLFFWGDDKQPGFSVTLDGQHTIWMRKILREQKSDALLLAALYHANRQSLLGGDNQFRVAICHCWRHILASASFSMGEDVVLDSWIYLHDLYPINQPTPRRIIEELGTLAHAPNTFESLRELEVQWNLPENSLQVKSAGFYRELSGRTTTTEYLEVLSPLRVENVEDAKKILLAWMAIGKRDYHRVKLSDCIIYYDEEIGKGLFYDQRSRNQIEFAGLPREGNSEWETSLQSLSNVAILAEHRISINLSRVEQETISTIR